MNEENNNFDISFEDNYDNITVSEEVSIPGNILGDDEIIGGGQSDEIQGPIIVNSSENDEVPVQDEPISGPIIVSNPDEEIVEETEEVVVENKKEEKIHNSTESFKDLENEIKNLKDEKVDVETKVKDLMKRRDELEILIKNKEDELNYKKEVEVTTDKLKTYIKDLEVKPGAVRDALAALINNMDN